MRVLVLVLPGVLDAGLGITLDVLGAANRLQTEAGRAPLFKPMLVSTHARSVTSGSGVRIGSLCAVQDAPRAELIVLASCNMPLPSEVDRWLATPANRKAQTWLRAQAALRKRAPVIATSCAGTFLLAEAGLLDGRAATTTWWLAPHFRTRYPQVQLDMERMVVPANAEGSVFTAGAAFAQADLMLALVTRYGSPKLARACARYLLLDERRSQARYAMLDHLARQQPELHKAERWIHAHLAEPFSVAQLADALHLTPRTLARHIVTATGMSPIRYVQRLRIDRAIELLETTRLPLQTIAERVGYADGATLRKLLLREHGVSPRGLRVKPLHAKPMRANPARAQ